MIFFLARKAALRNNVIIYNELKIRQPSHELRNVPIHLFFTVHLSGNAYGVPS